jgi:hypothetical protein
VAILGEERDVDAQKISLLCKERKVGVEPVTRLRRLWNFDQISICTEKPYWREALTFVGTIASVLVPYQLSILKMKLELGCGTMLHEKINRW